MWPHGTQWRCHLAANLNNSLPWFQNASKSELFMAPFIFSQAFCFWLQLICSSWLTQAINVCLSEVSSLAIYTFGKYHNSILICKSGLSGLIHLSCSHAPNSLWQPLRGSLSPSGKDNITWGLGRFNRNKKKCFPAREKGKAISPVPGFFTHPTSERAQLEVRERSKYVICQNTIDKYDKIPPVAMCYALC